MLNNIKQYLILMRFDRPIGTLLLLWPTLIALWFASSGIPNYRTLFIFIAGVIVTRAMGCIVNDYADRDIDPFVARTKNRPLATGAISTHNARILFTFLLILAFIIVIHLNPYTILLSCVALVLIIIYPYSKRFTKYPQVILGMAFGWSIPMAYAEVRNDLTIDTWILYFSNLLWVVAYDTEYAMADKDDDVIIGVHSTAITFGANDKKIIGILQCLSLLGFVWIGTIYNLNFLYYLIVASTLSLIIYQQWLIKDRRPERCLQAFKNNNYFGALLFIAVVVAQSELVNQFINKHVVTIWS